jgi:hypothetical protein
LGRADNADCLTKDARAHHVVPTTSPCDLAIDDR